ncbi:MAG: Alpha N-terminal protein methyltransferase 1 [Chrysothrix sp. TS-e1954]|nr:MAG: Alpha N-terminal protein methyltransferase 1 [Chrysothrix sp. TS-e1954]
MSMSTTTVSASISTTATAAAPASTQPTNPPSTSPNPPPDTQISHPHALSYWTSTPPTISGMLGGYPQVSRIDLQGSRTFLAKLRRSLEISLGTPKRDMHPPRLGRAVDCGAGIGRVTRGFLLDVAEVVDVVEPVGKFTEMLRRDLREKEEREGERGKLGTVENVGLEVWTPRDDYDIIWIQWCLGQLTDADAVACLARCGKGLAAGGWIVVKENVLGKFYEDLGEDLYDETDSTVTRRLSKWRSLFQRAGLKVVREETQRGFVRGLFPVRMWALQPK